jgi:hypothetical protein
MTFWAGLFVIRQVDGLPTPASISLKHLARPSGAVAESDNINLYLNDVVLGKLEILEKTVYLNMLVVSRLKL